MPRNPNKRRCLHPGCKAFAMRQLPDGSVSGYCRSHLDHILGPRGAGAPKGNLNALKTGRHANHKTRARLSGLAFELTQNADIMPSFLSKQFTSLLEQSGDIFLATAMITSLLKELLPLLADHIFHQEVYQYLQNMPPESRPKIEALIWKQYLRASPLKRLTSFRKMVKQVSRHPNYKSTSS